MKTLASVALAALLALTAAAQDLDPTDAECGECGEATYGTTIHWAGTPSEAARQAKAEEKLVFVLHVSGNFEEPDFT